MKYRPKKKETLQKWLEGGAFGELLTTGDQHLLALFNTYRNHGIDSAWLMYTALLFVEDNGILFACGEAFALYHEVVLVQPEDETNFKHQPVVDFINRAKVWQAYNSELINYRLALPRPRRDGSRARHHRQRWSIDPKPTLTGELVVLGNFLMLITGAFYSIKSEQCEKDGTELGYSTTDVIAITQSLRVFYEDVFPWFQNLPGIPRQTNEG